ncbi:hypothetical protein SAMD00019534_061280 [Acytostelium subglobosum LB1]|uniref:hypothetical protein n=1 Tax=Acytostelium subglobosum LB1 TaxID=1410327 RepID=UPI0006450198|nr:hypothetical protein SAMD00019534_061280 [Acytostelium subglobosum LB1]GAM22953.1 hypothetical protein SAMD00019534_061280 [Acytostelium subglobosum LB1]|eukprot:XP_012754180.1 hypothetical protein SAMD00019534_061280 [Acytostelium subglobosum LB1]
MPPAIKINYESNNISTHMANGGVVGNKHLKKTLSTYNLTSDTEHTIISDNATMIEVWLESNQALFSNLDQTSIFICIDSESNLINAILSYNPFSYATKWRKNVFVYTMVLEGMGKNTHLIKSFHIPLPPQLNASVLTPSSGGGTSSTSQLSSASSSFISSSPTSSTSSIGSDSASSSSPSTSSPTLSHVSSSPSSLSASPFSSFASSSSSMVPNGQQQATQQQQSPAILTFINNIIHRVTPQGQNLVENIQYLLLQSIQRALSNFVNSIQRDRLYYTQVVYYKKNEGMYLPTLFLAQVGLDRVAVGGIRIPASASTLSIASRTSSSAPQHSSSLMFLSSSPNATSGSLMGMGQPVVADNDQDQDPASDDNDVSSSASPSAGTPSTGTPSIVISPQQQLALLGPSSIHNLSPNIQFSYRKVTPELSASLTSSSVNTLEQLSISAASTSGTSESASSSTSSMAIPMPTRPPPQPLQSSSRSNSATKLAQPQPAVRQFKISDEQPEKPSLTIYNAQDNNGCAVVSSLYGWDFDKKERSGEPFADCFCLSTNTHPNLRATLSIADGTGQSLDSQRAAALAVLGANEYMESILADITTTNDLLSEIGYSIMAGHMRIIEDEYYQTKELHLEPKGATTFCIGCLGQTKNILQNLSNGTLSSSSSSKLGRMYGPTDKRAKQLSRPLPPPPQIRRSSLSPDTTASPNPSPSTSSPSSSSSRRKSGSDITVSPSPSTSSSAPNSSRTIETIAEEEYSSQNDAPSHSSDTQQISPAVIEQDKDSSNSTSSSSTNTINIVKVKPPPPRNYLSVNLSGSGNNTVIINTINNNVNNTINNNINNNNNSNINNSSSSIGTTGENCSNSSYGDANSSSSSGTNNSGSFNGSVKSAGTTTTSPNTADDINNNNRLASTDGQWFFMIGSVGDCRAFRLSCTTNKVTEITNSKNAVRNFNDAGGQLGWMWGGESGSWPFSASEYPTNQRPELRDQLLKAKNDKARPHLKNLHFGLVLVNPGDRVFIASDGITDNFLNSNPSLTTEENKPTSKEELEQNITNFIRQQSPEVTASCDTLCQAIVTHCLEKTQHFRNLQEEQSRTYMAMKEIEATGVSLSSDATYQALKKNHSRLINSQRQLKHGKPDHSSIVMYQVPHS